jgi:hypothetical protein
MGIARSAFYDVCIILCRRDFLLCADYRTLASCNDRDHARNGRSRPSCGKSKEERKATSISTERSSPR